MSRTELLLGNEAVERLGHSHVMVVGLGGVGGFTAELLARAGIGELTLVDADSVHESNINRQVIALHSTLKESKVELWRQRLLDISPEIKLHCYERFVTEEECDQIPGLEDVDYVVDAIDTLSPKAGLITMLSRRNIPFVSCMGAGSRLNPAAVRLGRLDKVTNCTLAKALRKRLRKMKTPLNIRVVFSCEAPREGTTLKLEGEQNKKSTSGTISFLPATFACHLAGEVVRELIQSKDEKAS